MIESGDSVAMPEVPETWDHNGNMSSLLAPDAQWLNLGSAANLLCCSELTLTCNSKTLAESGVRRISRNGRVDEARGVGWLYCRHDLELVKKIQRECQLSQLAALRVYRAYSDRLRDVSD